MVHGLSPGGIAYIAIANVLAVLATVAVLLRFLSRVATRSSNVEPGVRTGIGSDDWLCAASLPVYWFFVMLANLWATAGKIGFVTRDLTWTQLMDFFKIFWANQLTYAILCPIIKLSVLRLYRRLFWHYSCTRPPIIILEVLTISWGIAVLLTAIFQCTPVERAWNLTVAGTCINAQTFFWGDSISNLLLDVLILMVPAYPVWKSAMHWRHKMLVTGIFLLGSLYVHHLATRPSLPGAKLTMVPISVCIASIVHIITLGYIHELDIVLSLTTPAIWTTVEPGVAIISACLPCYWPWVRKRMQTHSSRSKSSRNNASGASKGSAQVRRQTLVGRLSIHSQREGNGGIRGKNSYYQLKDFGGRDLHPGPGVALGRAEQALVEGGKADTDV